MFFVCLRQQTVCVPVGCLYVLAIECLLDGLTTNQLRYPINEDTGLPLPQSGLGGGCHFAIRFFAYGVVVTDVAVGIDLGGSGMRAARVDREGRVQGEILRVPMADTGRDAVLSQMTHLLGQLLDRGPVMALGVGLPAFLRQPEGVITLAPNLPELTGWAAADAIRHALDQKMGLADLAVSVDNDADAAAYGEAWAGAGRGQNPFIYLGLGTGVGGGVVLNGTPLHGAHGMAAELGHLTVWPSGAPCGCGAIGCLEAYASSVGVLNAYHRAGGEGSNLSAKVIAERAQHGDRAALAAYHGAGQALGIAISQLIHVFNPACLAIGGGMAAAWDLFYEAMIAEVEARTPAAMHKPFALLPATLGEDSGVIGAAGLAWRAA